MRFKATRHPILYEINSRVWMTELSARYAAPVTLDRIPDEELDRLERWGIDLVWLMGVWPSGEKGAEIARSHPDLQPEYVRILPDVRPEDIGGSPYAIASYCVDPALGGEAALAKLRQRLAQRGIGLILDFVANHTGIDHPWTREQPELYLQGSWEDLRDSPWSFFAAETAQGPRVLAHGRDPYFSGWTDTAQLNVLRRDTRAALRAPLREIAAYCDGVRCDAAMLCLEQVFRGTWGNRATAALEGAAAEGELWSDLIGSVRSERSDFLFLAEAFWGLDGHLRALGFDYTYDMTFYERLVWRSAQRVCEHLRADLWYQHGCARFLETHDLPRAAATLPWERHRAAAVLTLTVPGMAMLHDGQLEGLRTKLPLQLHRRPHEAPDPQIERFYARLLGAVADPVFRQGEWRLLPTAPAWEDNPTWRNFVACEWADRNHGLRLVAVNFGPTQGQCYVLTGREELAGGEVELRDLLGEASYLRDGAGLCRRGLYLDMPGYGFHIFELKARHGS